PRSSPFAYTTLFLSARFPGVDTVLGPEMRSTGEVMGIDRSFEVAFAKSQLGGGTRVPRKGTVFVSVREIDKNRIADAVRLLHSRSEEHTSELQSRVD